MVNGRCRGAWSRSPDAAQRVALRGAVRCRAGAVTRHGVWYGPGSAERHEECRTASGTRVSILHAVAVQIVARGIEPALGAFDVVADPRHHPPEPRRVV